MINERIQRLRKVMKELNLDAFIVPSSDPHQSEYLAPHWKSREWISGFTGSAGIAVVTHSHAGLWTDSRYFIQAETELQNSEFVLHKVINRAQPQHILWLEENLYPNSNVAIDSALVSTSQRIQYESILSKKHIKLELTKDLIEGVWEDRPAIPLAQVFKHNISFVGQTRKEKLAYIKQQVIKKGCNKHLIATLDDIAWILNLRGRDIECNPVFIAFLLVGIEKNILFINEEKVSEEITLELKNDNIFIEPYSSITSHLSSLSKDDSILLDTSTINQRFYSAINGPMIIKGEMPSRLAKAKKNNVEIENLKQCMIKDGVALTHAFYELENQLNENKIIKENAFAALLAKCRSQQEDYYGESFNAIVGYNENGAIVHYHPEEKTSQIIKKHGILLVDSGGQYHDGTTDITRTICLSPPSTYQKQAYTNVLKGNIALTRAIFPKGTTGGQLDVLARQFLWNDNMNFLHGTGHGVGFFLNVHEGPQSISPGQSSMTKTPIELGMITSNEPGFYKEGEFGIRIENLILTVEKSEGFYGFETMTLFPIDTKLIELTMMTKAEIGWLNDYHDMVFNKLSPKLDKKYKTWLSDKCQKI